MHKDDLLEILEEIAFMMPGMTSKKMFGGTCFMLHGNMCFGPSKNRLMLRLGVDAERLIDHERLFPMDFTGRIMKGWAILDMDSIESKEDLIPYLEMALAFAKSLPPK